MCNLQVIYWEPTVLWLRLLLQKILPQVQTWSYRPKSSTSPHTMKILVLVVSKPVNHFLYSTLLSRESMMQLGRQFHMRMEMSHYMKMLMKKGTLFPLLGSRSSQFLGHTPKFIIYLCTPHQWILCSPWPSHCSCNQCVCNNILGLQERASCCGKNSWTPSIWGTESTDWWCWDSCLPSLECIGFHWTPTPFFVPTGLSVRGILLDTIGALSHITHITLLM